MNKDELIKENYIILNSANSIMSLSQENSYEKYFGNCRSVADFEKIEELGEGTYGRVCKD